METNWVCTRPSTVVAIVKHASLFNRDLRVCINFFQIVFADIEGKNGSNFLAKIG